MGKAALLTLHGMGTQTKGYAGDLIRRLRRRMGADFAQVRCVEILYQDLLQPNQQRVWRLLRDGLRWNALREFVLYSLGDAVDFEDAKEARDSVYARIQFKIAAALLDVRRCAGAPLPVAVIARSLGAHVLSCYLWDAQHFRPGPDNPVVVGLWADLARYEPALVGDGPPLTADEIEYLRGSHLRRLITTGCNIPVFVAAHAKGDIVPFAPPAPDFVWRNYYDADDILGWPLAPLSATYGKVVADHRVDIRGASLWHWLAMSWNPLVHRLYWEDRAVLDPLATALRELL